MRINYTLFTEKILTIIKYFILYKNAKLVVIVVSC